MSPSRIDQTRTHRGAFRRTSLSSLLLLGAMVLLAITLCHGSTEPDRFALVMTIILALVHAGIGYGHWHATHAPRTR